MKPETNVPSKGLFSRRTNASRQFKKEPQSYLCRFKKHLPIAVEIKVQKQR